MCKAMHLAQVSVFGNKYSKSKSSIVRVAAGFVASLCIILNFMGLQVYKAVLRENGAQVAIKVCKCNMF